ncbi:MAG: hypothetical protein M0Z93_05480 [Actinomycetota bacterium]|nr:hypothetical protein [Actinomycetota bacterium]
MVETHASPGPAGPPLDRPPPTRHDVVEGLARLTGNASAPDARRRDRTAGRSWLATGICVAVYLALAVAVYWNVWTTHPATITEPGGDQYATIWFLEWVPFAVRHGFNPLFTNFANYPFGVNLLTNTSVLLLGALAAPVTLVFGPVASFNLLLTLSLAGSASAGYALARRFVHWRPAAFVAGLVYGFSPYQIAQSAGGHLNLVFVVLPPLAFLVLHEIAVRQRGPARRWGIVLGVLVAAQYLISSEIMASTIIIGGLGVLVAGLCAPRSIRAHLRYAVHGLAWAAGVGMVLLAYPLWATLRGPGHITGPIQLVPQGYRADLLGPVIPDSLMRIAPAHLALIASHFANSVTENGSYLGITLLAVLAAGTIVLWREKAVQVLAVVGTLAFVLSLGAGLVVKSNPPGAPSGFPLPERLFAKIPLLSNTIPARYSLYVALCAALLLAVILDHVRDALATRTTGDGPGRRITAAVLAPVAIAVVALIPLIPAAPFTALLPVGTPAYFTTGGVAHLTPGSVAVIYPYPSSAIPNAEAWQAVAHLRFRSPGGYYLVPAADGAIAFSPAVSYARDTVTAATLVQLAAGAPPEETPALRAAILAQWRSWHVQSLVAFPSLAADPAGATAFLTWLTGRPPSPDDGASVWYHLRP